MVFGNESTEPSRCPCKANGLNANDEKNHPPPKLNASTNIAVEEANGKSPTASLSFLRPGLGMANLVVLMVASMMAIASLVFLNAMQAYVLVDLLGWDRSRLGQTGGTFALADELVAIPMVAVWGLISDRIGRRIVFGVGMLIIAGSLAAYPYAGCVYPSSIGSVVSSLLLLRLIFAVGASAATAMLTALIGDYASENGRGRLAGLVGMSTGLGALFAALCLSRLPLWLSRYGRPLHISFAITAGLVGLTALLILLFMANLRDPSEAAERSSFTFTQRLRIGLASISHSGLLLAYLAGFVARADSIALTLFIASWVDNHMALTGQCPVPTSTFTRCPAAKRLASNLMSVAHTTALLGAPLAGALSARLGHLACVAIPAGLGVLSFGGLAALVNPASVLAYVAMFGAGLAEIGMIIGGMAMMASQSPAPHRGALAGVYSLFGALGIVVTGKIGGWLFDAWRPTAAFLVVAVASLVVAGFSLAMLARRNL